MLGLDLARLRLPLFTMDGWIKLHRKMTEWEWYKDVNTNHLFQHLLLTANFQQKQWQGITIEAGQCVTGRESLAFQTGLSVQQIRTSLERLKSTSNITIKTFSKFSIITICNWIDYQDINQQVNHHLTSNQPASNQQVTTPKELKNDKNDKNTPYNPPEDFFELFWEVFPSQRKGNKYKARSAWNAALTRTEKEKIYESAKDYAASDEVARGFAKGAAAWLNDDRWNVSYRAGGIDSLGNNYDSRSITQNSGPAIAQPPSKWQIAGERVLRKIESGEI